VVAVASTDHALAEFLRLGADVEVLSPAGLRRRMQQTVRSLAELYQGSGTA